MSAALIQVGQLRVKPTAVAAAAHERARSRFSDSRHFCRTDAKFDDAGWPNPTAHLRVNRGLGGEVSQPRQSPGGTATFCEDLLARDSKS